MDHPDKGYDPQDVEKRWYAFWEENQLFAALDSSDAPAYSIVIPPPNVTGVLHMGHALNITLQDILCRHYRLKGHNVLWMPGTDHAGIATQNVVEKKLALEGRTRHQLGREKFIEAVWEWRQNSGSAIIHQLKRLGASCDWKRERFTMDEGLSRAVRKVFVQLYEEGLIYQGDYIINWCHRCHTALSDIEVEHEEIPGNLYHILYPFTDQSGGVIVATTRPETMFGDTAVAVNPEDERYRDLPSHTVRLPLTERAIPIIQDDYVGMSFGTGALKVTPAHDPNDFEIGNRHHLSRLKVIDDNGLMNENAGKFEGMDRFKCREAVVQALQEQGFLKKIEPHMHNVGHCYRCQTVVEPNLSQQWFVRTKPLAEKAIEAVQNGQTRIVPEIWTANYFDWLNNVRDWCISRQIWWGHQIPAWTCESCHNMTVALTAPETCPSCGQTALVQETDVLDTWFSSALWPFSTMGWPDHTDLLKTFYPTSTLVTGFDILFFWVARMMMMGIHFMKEVPFRDVYVHALVRDESGAKMSKSKGNVIDPLLVMDQYGTDAFRFTLAAFAAQGRDVRMSEKRVEGYRHFINKLWNASRFALMHVTTNMASVAPKHMTLVNKWILSRAHNVLRSAQDAIETYRFNDAAGVLYQFVWHEFCDWYLEAVKPALYGKENDDIQAQTRYVLWYVLKNTLRGLHPFIPFVTEEIWRLLPDVQGSIMTAISDGDDISDIDGYSDTDTEQQMAFIFSVITAIRNIRGEMNLPPSLKLSALLQTDQTPLVDIVHQHGDIISNLARLDNLTVEPVGERPRSAATAVVEGAVVYVPLQGIIDLQKEIQRLEKEIGKLDTELTGVSKKLTNEDFLSKAPADIIEKVRDKHAGLSEKHQQIHTNLERIKGFL